MENSNLVFEQLAARVDALLERLAQHERNEHNYQAQIAALKQERETLVARMQEAGARVNALLDRMAEPVSAPVAPAAPAVVSGGQHEAN